MPTRTRRWARRLVIAVIVAAALAVWPVLAAAGLSSAVAAPAGPVVTAVKACAPPPAPNRPTAGLPGKLSPAHPAADPGDPFTDTNVAISDVYGYSYRWVNYDTGCVPGSSWGPAFVTGVGNLLLAGAASTNALVHSTLGFVVEPTWLRPLDRTITEATETVRSGVWTPWITVALILVAGTVLVAAARAEISNAVTSAAWALLVLVATTYVMSYPVSSAQAVDGLIQETVTASARATSTGGADDASTSLTLQMDTINRNTLYSGWLEGTLGSSDSAVAREHGADLFRASHMTWWEAQTLDEDPAAGQAIIEEKKTLWSTTAAKVETADPLAYQQLTGNQGRWDAAATVAIMAAITMPFLLVAGVFVVIAYAVTRLFIPLAPALGVFGMLELARGWVIGVVGQLGRFLILGPLYWIGALINLTLMSSVFQSDLPFGVQAVIALALPLILFKLFRPKSGMPGGRLLRRMGRLAVHAAATKGAVKAGIDEAVLPDDQPLSRSAGPVAHSSQPTDAALPATWSLPGGPTGATGTAVATRQTFVATGQRSHDNDGRQPGSDMGFVTGGGVTARRAGSSAITDGSLELGVLGGNRGLAWREHPALTAGDLGDGPNGRPTGDFRGTGRPHVAAPADGDLAAPASSRLMRPEDPMPIGIAEANVRDVDGEEVFTLWRPVRPGSADADDTNGSGGER